MTGAVPQTDPSAPTGGDLPYRLAVRALERAQKSPAGVPPYSRYINRPLGRRIAAGAAVLGVTPNQITLISALWSVAGFVLLVAAPPSVPMALGVTLLFTLAWAFDAADGQLARLTGRSGPAGEWLDHVVDAARQPLLHLAVLAYLLRADGFELSWVHALPLVYLTVGTIRFLSQILAEQLTRNAGAPPAAESGRPELRALLQTPADPSTLHLAFLLAFSPRAFTIAYTIVLACNVPLALVSFGRRYRQLAALSAD